MGRADGEGFEPNSSLKDTRIGSKTFFHPVLFLNTIPLTYRIVTKASLTHMFTSWLEIKAKGLQRVVSTVEEIVSKNTKGNERMVEEKK